MNFHEQILQIMKDKSKQEHEYINPHFLQEISGLLWDYYELEDDEVDTWISGMFGT